MKHKVFIIFLTILILFIACGPNKPDDRVMPRNEDTAKTQKQQIIDDIQNLLQTVTSILKVHNDNAWNETAQGYNLSAANQLFSVIQHTPQGQAAKLYNTNDADSKTARREMYLAFEYNKDYIKAFGTLANKMAANATATPAMKTTLEGIVNGMREYVKAYYLQAFDTINNKKDELKKLSLDNLNTLHDKINAIQEAKTNIVNAADKIKEDYDKDIEVGKATPKNKLRTTATATEIKDYLESKRGEFEKEINTIKQTANEIINILTSP
ncbi:virulence associated lipoprotein (plasmid) [Borrelia puertoricensis]|uniref:virulence associated lipoprotein n=1 Tax=Borrelia puertoricensis TaxID=2756107 RepID=UPI001FF2A600|nr:virulence associated lipoprotein [Borrelia puertoricensis]UPA18941.1 hypothetical protein bpuSUM_001479 [Borrelia puertoricensis]